MPNKLSLQEIWSGALEIMRKKVNRAGLETWHKTITPVSFDDTTFTLGVPSEFLKDWLEKRSAKSIKEALKTVCGTDINLLFTVVNPENNDKQNVAPADKSRRSSGKRQAATEAFSTFSVNPKYTFDTFVVGNSNRFAQAAAMAICKEPEEKYNLLFIYGGPGLGKTHLMHAIGNYLLQNKKNCQSMFVSGEHFTNDLITSIQEGRTSDFRDRYRSVDVWLVDDIQFIAHKDRTQEEFFHTFNTLYETNKKIVIASDRPANELLLTGERLASRLQRAITANIEPPDFETRIAILQRKAESEGLDIPTDVIEYIANNITTNIRDLEGALVTVAAFISLTGIPVTLERAQELLKHVLSQNKPREITIQHIQKMVADHFGLKIADLKSAKRNRDIVLPRQIAMYICRELTEKSQPEIGGHFGGRDHSTVIHACKQIKNLSLSDESLLQTVKSIMDKIKS